MDAISSQEESTFPGFYWRGRPTFHKYLRRSLPSAIGMREGLWAFCLKWNRPQDALTQWKAGFPSSVLNAGSSFISQDEIMYESPVECIEKALASCLIWRVLTYLDTLKDTQSSMLQNVTMPDSSWELIGNPISLCQLEKEAYLLLHLQNYRYFPAKPSLDSWGVHCT